MNDIDEIVKLNLLYDIYGKLLTDKQRDYFEKYYFENLSFGEIAENNNVSREAVHSQLKIIKSILIDFDEKLMISKTIDMVDELKELNDERVNEILSKYEEK